MQDLLSNRTAGRLTAFLVAMVLVAGLLSFLYAREHWWLPPLASQSAGRIDAMFMVFLVVIGAVFVAVHAFLAYVLYRFVMGPGDERSYWHEDSRVEFVWTVLTTVALVILLIMGLNLWLRMQGQPAVVGPDIAEAAADGALTIEVVGTQFAWQFRYPGPDGRLAAAAPQFITPENPLGVDPDDPAGEDDIVVTNELVLPQNRPVHLRLRALDVLHSFFLPHFRLKYDTVPGRETEIWLNPTEKGEYEAACAELCGPGHYVMRSRVAVVDPAEFEEWTRSQAARDDGR